MYLYLNDLVMNEIGVLYPVGIQDFKEIREKGMVYVDKTNLIYKLVKTCKYTFLSRPRRFGKSLLTSTLHYYFEGRKDLFQGLAMEKLEKEWIQYPVLHFDLSRSKDCSPEDLTIELHKMLDAYDKLYNVKTTSTPGSRLNELISTIFEKTGKQVVLLIDEYDAPIMDVLHKPDMLQDVRNVMRNFYASLKANDSNLKFVFITGVSTFSQMGIFSELNNLTKITTLDEYATICGITEQELVDNFQQGIGELATKKKVTKEEILAILKDKYDGYHFSGEMVDIYNPFSLLNAFYGKALGDYWFDSGTSKALLNAFKRYVGDFKIDLEEIDAGKWVKQVDFMNSLEDDREILPLLYQSGYITIKNYDLNMERYILGVPNEEVRTGLYRNILPLYTQANVREVVCYVDEASQSLREGNMEKCMEIVRSLLKSIPYGKNDTKIFQDLQTTEQYYHALFHVIFRMLNGMVTSEVRNSTGATDVEITTPKYIYVVELKIDASPSVALKQIDRKGYVVPHMADHRAVYKVGVTFSTKERTLSEWKIVKEKGFTE
jgi:hypothetical protein